MLTTDSYKGTNKKRTVQQLVRKNFWLQLSNSRETWLSENGAAYDYTILKNTNHKSCDSKQKLVIVKLAKKVRKRG